MNYARVTPPSVKTNYIDIAGSNSSIDLTEAVGGLTYSDGKIEFKFTFKNREDMQAMMDDLHGRKFEAIILEREPEYYYSGRIEVKKQAQVRNTFELELMATVGPYKIEVQESEHNEDCSGKLHEIILSNSRMDVIPTITVQGNVYLETPDYKCVLKTGIYNIPEIVLHAGINRWKVSGNGSIRLNYHKGKLII